MPTTPLTRTPESRTAGLRRIDSRNALTTCHGVTSAGRACRRPLANSKPAAGVVDFAIKGTFIIPDRDTGRDPTVSFCWQHKHQTALLGQGDRGDVVHVETGRRSLETVLAELRLEEVAGESDGDFVDPSAGQKQVVHGGRVGHSGQRNHVDGKRGSPTRDRLATQSGRQQGDRRQQVFPAPRQPISKHRPQQTRSKSNLWTSLFSCFSGNGIHGITVDEPPQIRQKHSTTLLNSHSTQQHRTVQHGPVDTRTNDYVPTQSPKRRADPQVRRKSRPNTSPERPHAREPNKVRFSKTTHHTTDNHHPQPKRLYPNLPLYRPVTLINRKDPSPRPPKPTKRNPPAKDWHPTLPANPTDATRLLFARLLTTMSELPTKADSPGYIYIFWQTEDRQSPDETAAAQSLISINDDNNNDSENRIPSAALARSETILRRPRATKSSPRPRPDRPTIFLKIGRAQNVHQRLTQWRKQCAYDISLLRSYPLPPSFPSSSSSPHRQAPQQPIKIPYVGKVEKLIHLHLEMLGLRVRKQCRCGTLHQEWFEVEASVGGIRGVDGVVRDWVAWSEGRFGREV